MFMMAKKKEYGLDYPITNALSDYTEKFEEQILKIFDLEKRMIIVDKEIKKIRASYEGTLKNDLVSKITGFFGIGSLVVAFYFLAPNFTGNIIGNIEVGNSNLFGMGLFLFGLLNIFVCLKKCVK